MDLLVPQNPNSVEVFIYGALKYAQGMDWEKMAKRLCEKVIPELVKCGRIKGDGELQKQQVNARAKYEQGYVNEDTFAAFINGLITPEQFKAYATAGAMLTDGSMPQATYEQVMLGGIDASVINEVYTKEA